MATHKLLITLWLGILAGFLPLTAQQTPGREPHAATIREASDLYEAGQFGQALRLFNKLSVEPANSYVAEQARFLGLLCQLELQHPDAAEKLSSYLLASPQSPYLSKGAFALGHAAFIQRDYLKAEEWFAKVDRNLVPYRDLEDYLFESGYSLFQNGKFDQAINWFEELAGSVSVYNSAAIYYLAHIDFSKGRLANALNGYRRLEKDPGFGKIVPFSITQIYYMQADYRKVIEYGTASLALVSQEQRGELSGMIGSAHFQLADYASALPLLLESVSSGSPGEEIYYQLGYSAYRANRFDVAATYLEKVSAVDSPIGQNALYYLADCYIRKGEKNRARLAFASASRMSYDKALQEDAAYQSAVVNFELGFSPFNEIVNSFEEFLKVYPASSRREEVYKHLVAAYTQSKNYGAALESLDKIPVKDAAMERASQKVALFHGLELFNDQQFVQAQALFDRSLQYARYDAELEARAIFWKAEALYRSGNDAEAGRLFRQFLSLRNVARLPEYQTVYYNYAYTGFNTKDYSLALDGFTRFVQSPGAETELVADAWNRIADCHFMAGSFTRAIEGYDKAVSYGTAAADYALFQKAIAQGLSRDYNGKYETLRRLVSTYPQSGHLPASLFEQAKSLVVLNQPEQAALLYKQLLEKYPQSPFSGRAYNDLALIAYNAGRNQEAIDYYKKVVTLFPNSQDARSALLGMKTVYVDANGADEYIRYVESLQGGMANITPNEQEELLFQSAEQAYMAADYSKATALLEGFLQRFSSGPYSPNAHYYLGDCLFRSGNQAAALQHFETTASGRNSFTEQALLVASRIRFSEKQYEAALAHYLRLTAEAEIAENRSEAVVGKMRCYYLLKRYPEAAPAAESVLTTGAPSEEIRREAIFVKAKSLLAGGNQNGALTEFRKLGNETNSAEGAEAKFRVAEILFARQNYDEAEKLVFEFADKGTRHLYWMGQAFLLLSDVYIAKKDNFQALHTLKSIIENYENKSDGVIEAAKVKLQKVEAQAAAESAQHSRDVEINLNK